MSQWGWIGPGGPAGLQNRDGGAFGDSGGFDSHTPPPARAGRRVAPPRLGLLLGALLLLPLGSAPGQDTTVTAGPAQDTISYPQPPASPLGAFFRSLLLPGWGQSIIGRRLTAGLFIVWEGVTLGMTVKADRELNELKQSGAGEELLDGKRQEREDWLVLLLFNHLFAGLEAFVGTHLWDFPEDVRIRGAPAPEGFGVRVSVPLPR